jgi:uncharacterized membrane protein YeaQ/YmgE (transglycosylase-associated protein family)
MTVAVQVASWLIAGAVASWLVSALAGVGRLGMLVDWLLGPAVALLAGWLLALLTQHPVEALDWWFSIPVAFVGAIVVISVFRILSHAHPNA